MADIDFTHHVSLWLDNDAGIYRRLMDVARERAEETEGSTRKVLDAVEAEVNDILNEARPSIDNDMMRELLDLAIESIDTHGLAMNYAESAVETWEIENPEETEA